MAGFLSPQPTPALKLGVTYQVIEKIVVGNQTLAVSSPSVTEAVSGEP